MKNMEEDVAERGRPAQRGNVSRIKSMFQQDLDPKSQHDNRIAYNRNLGFSGSRSPEVKRKRADLVIDTNKQNSVGSNKNADVPSTLDTNLVDPQKYFESTSHVQRFQFTRAIFAQMEQKTKEEKQKTKPAIRKLSPNRMRAVSPTSPVSRSPVKQDHNRKSTHPLAGSSVDNLTKHYHDNRDQEHLSRPHIPNKPDYLRTRSNNRAESLDRLDNDFGRRNRSEDRGVQNRNLDSQRNSMSRSDSDLTRDFSTEQRDNDDAHVSARYLRQRYEDHTDKPRSSGTTGSHEPRSSRLSQQNKEQKDQADALSVGSSHSSYMSDSGFQTSVTSDGQNGRSNRSVSPE